MKKYVFSGSVALLLGATACTGQTQVPNVNPIATPDTIVVQPTASTRTKKIKLAILLDTSGSMEGLINQAKNQLWKIVNQLALAKDADGNDPEIEIALYQYGNDGLDVMDGYVQQISGFTSELDEISEQLFALRTNGGSEYCGTVIHHAVDQLEWSDSQEDLQMVFIAGNEPFSQGEYDYVKACMEATDAHIVVNTIFCGRYAEGSRTGWSKGATLGNGKYMNIDSDAKIVHVASPYDDQIIQLNQALNKTYLPYGQQGLRKKEKQIAQDQNAESISSANAAKRYISKGSKVYKNQSWDLVDAAGQPGFDISKVEQLPDTMQHMTDAEKLAYIKTLETERKQIQQQIKVASQKRRTFVANAQLSAGNEKNLDDAILEAIVAQAKQRHYYFE